jgi:DNA-binding transcriptional MerR regulator/effector-binding domain-containing protein
MNWNQEDEAARVRRKGMFAIGEFSRITGLTIKAVRLYHEKGLLQPTWIDGDSGYRYFTERDVERARAVADLRELDFSLADIADLLNAYDDDAGVLGFLESQRRRIEERRENLGRIARRLDRMIRAEREAQALLRKDVSIVAEKDLSPMLVAGLRWKGRYAETGAHLGRVCRQFGRFACDAPLNLYFDGEHKEDGADIESCIPVRQARESSGFTLHTLPGGRFASLVHRGSYETIGRSYMRLVRFLRDRGYSAILPYREIYRKGPGLLLKGNPNNYLTEIQICVASPSETTHATTPTA